MSQDEKLEYKKKKRLVSIELEKQRALLTWDSSAEKIDQSWRKVTL